MGGRTRRVTGNTTTLENAVWQAAAIRLALSQLMELVVLLVRPGDHAREHREQRGPRGGGHGGRRPASVLRRRRGSGGGGGGGTGGCGGVGPLRRPPARPHFLLPLVPAVFGPVQVPVLVEHQTDAGRPQPVRFPERRGGVQLLFGHLEQHGTVAERYGHAAHLRVLQRIAGR